MLQKCPDALENAWTKKAGNSGAEIVKQSMKKRKGFEKMF